MDTGIEKIDDVWVLAQIRRQARKVYIESLLASALITALIALIPNFR